MKARTIILLAIAVVCGLGAAYLTTRLTARPPEGESVEVLVAKDNILQGTLLKDPDKFFEVRKIKKEDVPPGAKQPKDIKEVQNRQLRRGLPAKTPLLDWHLGKAMGVAVTLPDGHRAMSLPANVNKDAGGFILPNTRVDVICTVNEGERARSQVIMQNVLVMAVNQQEDSPEQGQSVVPHNVTLAIKPEDTELLALAVDKGRLLLTLRKAGDEEHYKTAGVTNIFSERTESTGARVDGVMVVVAKKDINADTVIDIPTEYFKLANLPKDSVPTDAITDLNLLNGKKINRKVGKLHLISADDLIDRGEAVITKVPEREAEQLHHLVIINSGKSEVHSFNKEGQIVPGGRMKP